MSDAERRRLLYVATTRAQDHLVVSLHRTVRQHELPAHVGGAAGHVQPTAPASASTGPRAPPAGRCADAGWSCRGPTSRSGADVLGRALERAAVPSVLSATALAKQFVLATTDTDATAADGTGTDAVVGLEPPGQSDAGGEDPALRKDAVDLDLPPWQRGRYGTAVGRAVHAVLQHADLVDGSRPARRWPSPRPRPRACSGMERTIEALAALRPVDADRARRRASRSTGASCSSPPRSASRVVEGYIDLLVRHPERGLVVVDYKTDQLARARRPRRSPGPLRRAARGVRHRPGSRCSASRSTAACSSCAPPPARPRRSRSPAGRTCSASCAPSSSGADRRAAELPASAVRRGDRPVVAAGGGAVASPRCARSPSRRAATGPWRTPAASPARGRRARRRRSAAGAARRAAGRAWRRAAA